ncbi:bifunctional 2-polyprenyl-6-hydroxyphenol methylase/3-demethylubiquinol 3-O-methyltransferase UbiG [Amycolatopsis sp. 195334CR]|uniref:class I SAM-dependent methyltransferase n=1 Tax=Amycolatopsis sp. 195334CR TaxID=2814588 RepID=UPI001A8F6DE3|nr:class I SAM-dependent methyltransferase [Amycolatopsis sp. 195334CR]MBN6040564.1 class I SAM-dependent methyltransferase [Amycolatopsis sp. 195334CR]
MSGIPSSTWYVDFFTELPNEFWRRAVPPETTVQEIDFLEQNLGLTPRSRILDVPCGSGRHSLELARRGHRVTGVDLSAEAIGHARRAAAGLDVEFVQADMREIPRDAGFDAVLCLGNSFGYLELDGLREFAAALGAAVRPGGGLVVDFGSAAESILPGYRAEPRTLRTGDITVLATSEYDVAGSRVFSRYRFSRGGEEVDVTAIHHVYTVAQLVDLLSGNGFIGIELFGGPAGEAYELGSGRLLLTARRG